MKICLQELKKSQVGNNYNQNICVKQIQNT